MRKYLGILVIICVFVSSCGDPKPTANNESQEKEHIVTPKESYKKNKSSLRSQALAVLDHRIKLDPKSYAVAEAGVWEYEFVFDGKEMSPQGEKAGSWIDFKDDNTYQYGLYNEIQGAGKYNYRIDDGQIVMVDDDESVMPQEWNTKSAGDNLILIGTQSYGNNAYQMKLVRRDTIPVKSE